MNRRPVQGGDSWGAITHCTRWVLIPLWGGRVGWEDVAMYKERRGLDTVITKLIWPLFYLKLLFLSTQETFLRTISPHNPFLNAQQQLGYSRFLCTITTQSQDIRDINGDQCQ